MWASWDVGSDEVRGVGGDASGKVCFINPAESNAAVDALRRR